MASLGLKLFYLRTRVRDMSQQAVADRLGIRQATLSDLERSRADPSGPLLLELCKFYDVSPVHLLDDRRPVVPGPTDRWSLRDALVTVGMWIEVPADAIVQLPDGKLLCPLLEGEAFYDDEARRARQQSGTAGNREVIATRREEDRTLVRALQSELRKHPQRRRR